MFGDFPLGVDISTILPIAAFVLEIQTEIDLVVFLLSLQIRWMVELALRSPIADILQEIPARLTLPLCIVILILEKLNDCLIL